MPLEEEIKKEPDLTPPAPVVGPAPKERPVMQAEFAGFQSDVKESLGALTQILSNVATELKDLKAQPKFEADSNGVRIVNSQVKDDASPGFDSGGMVPPAWRVLTDEILGPDFSISLRLPENGGQIFSVKVPKNKSNASEDHWNMHKSDERSRELGNTGVKGVKEYLLKIRKNLTVSEIKLPYYGNTDPSVGLRLK